jgi:hypothetical protein
MENNIKQNIQKNIRFYYMPIPFGFPMYDPYNTGPMSEPILSSVGPPIAPRRNPYYPKPTNPFLNPYTNQMRMAMRTPYMPMGAPPMGAPMGCPPPCGPRGAMGGPPPPPPMGAPMGMPMGAPPPMRPF